MNARERAELVVIGAGPGGYAAAFLAADLDLDVTLVDPEENPGGVCLYRGCIPSKALLHVAETIETVRHAETLGVRVGTPEIDLDGVRAFGEDVVARLTGGLGQVAERRGVRYVRGRAAFEDGETVRVEPHEGEAFRLPFGQAIVATGSQPAVPSAFPAPSERVWTSGEALALPRVPERLLVVGGGYIGLELGSVYAALGSRVTVVEMLASVLPGADRDLVRPLAKRLEDRFEAILVSTRVVEMEERDDGVRVVLDGDKAEPSEQTFDVALVAVGRRVDTADLGLERAGIEVTEKGPIRVDDRRRTTNERVLAIGDVTGEPMLAHKATREGRVAAEVAAGHPYAYDPAAVPAVVYTDPEVAWCGLTETEAREAGRDVAVARFPWAASGRAITMGRDDGLTKLVLDPDTERVLGVGLCGPGAGELIAEGALAIEMGAVARDLALTVHPHPTRSETLMEAAEVFFGQATSIYRPKR